LPTTGCDDAPRADPDCKRSAHQKPAVQQPKWLTKACPWWYDWPAGAEKSKQVANVFTTLVMNGSGDAPGGAVLVIKDSHIVHQAAYGLANVGRHTSLTPSTCFRLER
jgi:hypothetical protein